MIKVSIQDILSVVEKFQLLQDPRVLAVDEIPKDYGAIEAIEGKKVIAGYERTIVIGIDKYFPYHKPQFFLKGDYSDLYLPHLSPEGFICYVQEEDLLIDYRNIDGIINEAFSAAVSEIDRSFRSKNLKDYAKEFEVYWGYLNPKLSIISLISLGGKPRLLPVTLVKEDFMIVGNSIKYIQYYLNKKRFSEEKIAALKFTQALYLPLQKNTLILPPKPDSFWNNSQIVDYLFQNVNPKYKNILIALLKKNPNKGLTVVADLPVDEKTSSLFGITFKVVNKVKKHPLISRIGKHEAHPAIVIRNDREYVLPRGGSSLALLKKSVLLIGCGALGSVIAEHLVKSGITSLALIDDDILKIENIYRHKLGAEFLHQKKVEALKADLERNLIYANITTYPIKIEEFLREKSELLKDFDLVIAATANPTVNLLLNEYLHNMDIPYHVDPTYRNKIKSDLAVVVESDICHSGGY